MKEELRKRDADLASETAKVQSYTEEISKKDEALRTKTSTVNQLKSLGKRYKDLSADSDAKLKKV